ncbi:MAG: TadE family protein [Pseudomonadota bacterium]
MIRRLLRRLRGDTSGVALIEFAITLPALVVMCLTGAEITNYIITKMRVSQLALHLADNAARIGSGSQLSSKKITETDINDLLTGAGLQAGELDLYTRGRVVISDLEPMANPNVTGKYKIVWQRCRGSKAYTRAYGTAGQTNLNGMGPAGRQVDVQPNSATIFIEVAYDYKPLVGTTLVPATTFTEIGSMSVRDKRDLSQIYNTEGATVSSC